MEKDELYDMGLIGLAVMGQNLALNMIDKGLRVAVYNRTLYKTQSFVKQANAGAALGSAVTIADFVEMLRPPRKIMLMVKAGLAVDAMIEELLPHVEPGDIIIDGGNSFFADTRRRSQYLEKKGIYFLGAGVSGGEEGALHGPSLMPGGSQEAYKEIAPYFEKIAAKVPGGICCKYVGKDGAGHYVKMVHNGIEYGDMQLISEAYYLMKMAWNFTEEEMHDIFANWNNGELNSYLIEITRDIFLQKDEETGQPLLELILDKAGQKGTGIWTSQSALELGVPVPTITEAVYARCMSALKDERMQAAQLLAGPSLPKTDRREWIQAVHDALYASKICSYAQGFALLKAAAKEYDWNLSYAEIALLWRGGCIIRAEFLDRIAGAFEKNKELPNLMLDPFFKEVLQQTQENWRKVVCFGKQAGIPLPAFSASLDYYDSYRQAVLPANMIQAQRDYFGAHTYQRRDKEGVFHTKWQK